jgi:serine/threonine protein kinase
MDGIVCIQVHLVMQYCDMGTLEQAIRRGDFHDPRSGQPKLRTILLTALEIARGLQYLHHPDRRMVHRDLSAANVLLATASGDERGFKALLSDFGLSTSLAAGATHRTSEVKGTLRHARGWVC